MQYHRKQKRKSGVNRKSGKYRLSVFRSSSHIYAQLIDDTKNITLVSSSSLQLKDSNGGKVDGAKRVGADIAKKALEKNIQLNIMFDRGDYVYAGRIKALAEAARESGLKF